VDAITRRHLYLSFYIVDSCISANYTVLAWRHGGVEVWTLVEWARDALAISEPDPESARLHF
jgi:hypothetical protein